MSTLDLLRNPFFVLELSPEAGPLDVERQGKRLVAELELGRPSARRFPSPFGEQPRDETAVRAAVAALRDPRLRALYARFVPPRAVWPLSPPADVPPVEDGEGSATAATYPELTSAVPAGPRWLRPLLAADVENGRGRTP